jgi:hypothetical protein
MTLSLVNAELEEIGKFLDALNRILDFAFVTAKNVSFDFPEEGFIVCDKSGNRLGLIQIGEGGVFEFWPGEDGA